MSLPLLSKISAFCLIFDLGKAYCMVNISSKKKQRLKSLVFPFFNDQKANCKAKQFTELVLNIS